MKRGFDSEDLGREPWLFTEDGKIRPTYKPEIRKAITERIEQTGMKELARDCVMNAKEYRALLRTYGKDFSKAYIRQFEECLEHDSIVQMQLDSLPSIVHVIRVIEESVDNNIGNNKSLEAAIQTAVGKSHKDYHQTHGRMYTVIRAKLWHAYGKVMDGMKQAKEWRNSKVIQKKQDDIYPVGGVL